MRGLRLLIIVVLTIFSAAVPARAESPSERCSSSVITLRTLHIKAVPEKRKATRGQTFKVKVTVTRPAHEDPLGQGIEFEPPASVPAAGVTVGLSVWVGERTYFWQVGRTDENGKETLKLTVPKNSEKGWALAAASARNWVKSDCPDILEEGYTYYPRFVKIVP